jgi:hypothetical protein
VQEGDKVRRYSERMVRRLLERQELSGAELARQGDGPWVRLHETALFKDSVPHAGGNLRNVVLMRALRPWGSHLAIFVAVNVFMGWPAWWFWWGIGLLAHSVSEAPKIWAAATMAPAEASAAPVTASSAPVARSEPASAFEATAHELLADLDDSDPALAEEVRQLEAVGRKLAKRIASLDKIVGDTSVEELTLEADRLRAEIEVETDARDADVLRRELQSLEVRRAILDDAAKARDRLQAEERALVHEVEGLRIALARAAVSADEAPDLLAQVRSLREQAAAEAEVDEELARARMARSGGRQAT